VTVRYGVLSDVHGNLPALEAALAGLASLGVDGYLVAGDLVGYGPFPNECVAAVAALAPVCVAGNHDLIALGRLSSDRCIPLARRSLEWTRSVLGAEARAYLAGLPLRADAAGGRVVVAHGSLEDPSEYTTRPEQAAAQLERLGAGSPTAQILLLGHTHRPWACDDAGAVLRIRSNESLVLREARRVVLNPGAVGQSRERLVRARFLVLDLERMTATYHAVRYDTARCRRALRSHGLHARSYHLRRSAFRALRPIVRSAWRRARRR
jgi:predicted phosphodiesterase